jgi:hypothetical protein
MRVSLFVVMIYHMVLLLHSFLGDLDLDLDFHVDDLDG